MADLKIKWALVLVAGLGTMVFLLLADVIFVTYYALLANPGQEQAYYNQFALDTAGAFIFCFAPFPVYLISRWLCDKAGHAHYLHAVLLIAAFYLIDVIMIAGMGTWEGMGRPEYWLNAASMLAGALAGAFFAKRAESASQGSR
jgi:hypothetical protein